MTKTRITNVKQLKRLLEIDLNCTIDLGDKNSKITQYLLSVVDIARSEKQPILEENYEQIKAFVSSELNALKQKFEKDNANGSPY